MLGIRKLEHLASNVGESKGELLLAAEYGTEDVREFTLWHPDLSRKPRDVISLRGRWRRIQSRLNQRIFRTRLKPSLYSHGGVPKRHVLSNAIEHCENEFVLSMDVANFYPSISNTRVNRLFLKQLHCSPEVARVLTRLCTNEFHLALGLPTSPFLADQIMTPIDRRIGEMCSRMNLRYTRYVDDITISGKFDLESAGVAGVVEQILDDHGLKLKEGKTRFGRVSDGFAITGVRFNRGHPDVARTFIREVERLLEDHLSLAAGGQFHGPLMTSSQMEGKVHSVCWINPYRRLALQRKLRTIRWDSVYFHAVEGKLVRFRSKMTPRGEPPPDLSVPISDSRGANEWEAFRNSAEYDPDNPPF